MLIADSGDNTQKAPETTPNRPDNNNSDPEGIGDNGSDGPQQAPEPAPDRSDDDDSDPEGSGDGDSGLQDIPTNGWKEFDEDAVYQKKHVDPEMRQWVLTSDCRRIISDKYFNNPPRNQGTCSVFPEKRTDFAHLSSATVGHVL